MLARHPTTALRRSVRLSATSTIAAFVWTLSFVPAQTGYGLASVFNAPAGQPGDPSKESYRDAVLRYQSGELDVAEATVMRWSTRDLKRVVVAARADQQDWRFIEAAVMFHTDIALRRLVQPKDSDTASLHLALAEEDVRALTFKRPPTERAIRGLSPGTPFTPEAVVQVVEQFQQSWYLFAPTVFFAQTDPSGASSVIQRGLHLFKNSGPLRMLAGVVEEMRAHLQDDNLHDRRIIVSMPTNRIRPRLVFAEAEYRRALELAPDLLEARLRLGRVLFLRNDPKQARQHLEAVNTSTTPVRLRYLAHLFLGALAAYEHDLDRATREFDAALVLAPRFQTPYVASSFTAHMTGHDDRARELVSLFARLPKASDSDPWWDYQNGALDDGTLTWLRAEVSR